MISARTAFSSNSVSDNGPSSSEEVRRVMIEDYSSFSEQGGSLPSSLPRPRASHGIRAFATIISPIQGKGEEWTPRSQGLRIYGHFCLPLNSVQAILYSLSVPMIHYTQMLRQWHTRTVTNISPTSGQEYHCLCGESLRQLAYLVKNRLTGKEAILGPCCIRYVKPTPEIPLRSSLDLKDPF
jgi:hypothetical protein